MCSTLYSCQILTKLGFVDRFSKNPRIPNISKIRPVGTELFNADGQRDGHDEVTCHFSQFCEKRLQLTIPINMFNQCGQNMKKFKQLGKDP